MPAVGRDEVAMDISLTPDLEQIVSDRVKSGRYSTATEVVREGLRLLNERDRQSESLRRDVAEGLKEIERGEYSEFDEENVQELAQRIQTRGRMRIARVTQEP